VILYDATLRNQTDDGTPFIDVLLAKGIIPIIKVDKSTTPHTGHDGEVVTQGLDDLTERLKEYFDMGARAAKWRMVANIGAGIPTEQNVLFNCIQMVRYAELCHEAGIVPIVEPEVIFKGSHDLAKAEEVTTQVLRKLFELLQWYGVDLKGVILKSSMVLAGSDFPEQTPPEKVAETTIRTFKNSVPHDIPGIVFLSGGQTPERATANLNAIAKVEIQEGNLPWEFAFSFSRGIEEPVQKAWRGEKANVAKAQDALIERLRLNSLADAGEYQKSMEGS
jgi:fructose-bisphosphate aldolase class I